MPIMVGAVRFRIQRNDSRRSGIMRTLASRKRNPMRGDTSRFPLGVAAFIGGRMTLRPSIVAVAIGLAALALPLPLASCQHGEDSGYAPRYVSPTPYALPTANACDKFAYDHAGSVSEGWFARVARFRDACEACGGPEHVELRGKTAEEGLGWEIVGCK